jgi:hypothetical protein
MTRIISRKSIEIANYNVRCGRSCVIGSNKEGVTARTSFGSFKINVSHKDVAKAGEAALRKYSK